MADDIRVAVHGRNLYRYPPDTPWFTRDDTGTITYSEEWVCIGAPVGLRIVLSYRGNYFIRSTGDEPLGPFLTLEDAVTTFNLIYPG